MNGHIEHLKREAEQCSAPGPRQRTLDAIAYFEELIEEHATLKRRAETAVGFDRMARNGGVGVVGLSAILDLKSKSDRADDILIPALVRITSLADCMGREPFQVQTGVDEHGEAIVDIDFEIVDPAALAQDALTRYYTPQGTNDASEGAERSDHGEAPEGDARGTRPKGPEVRREEDPEAEEEVAPEEDPGVDSVQA